MPIIIVNAIRIVLPGEDVAPRVRRFARVLAQAGDLRVDTERLEDRVEVIHSRGATEDGDSADVAEFGTVGYVLGVGYEIVAYFGDAVEEGGGSPEPRCKTEG